MTATAPRRLTWRAALTDRAFVGHYLQMLVAMGIGMLVLGPLAMRVVHHAGPEGEMVLMATTMVVGTAVWMLCRRHAWTAVMEMSVVMYASVAVLFPFYRLGSPGTKVLTILGHVLMLLGMAIVMLHRRESYVGAQTRQRRHSTAARADRRCGTRS
jgi:hypothetical protein